MADESGRIIFSPELDLSQLDADAERYQRRLLLMFKEVSALGGAEKKRFLDQLGVIEQLSLREQRLVDLRNRANSTSQITKLNAALRQTQTEMQNLTTTTQQTFKKSESAVSNFTEFASKQFQALSSSFIGLFAAQRVLSFINDTSKEFLAQQEIISRLAFTLEKVKGETHDVTEAFIAQAQSIEKKGLFADETVEAAQLMLTQFGLIPKDVMAATDIIARFALVTNKSMEEATGIFIDGLKGRGMALKDFGIFVDASSTIAERYNQILGKMNDLSADSESALDKDSRAVRENSLAWSDAKERIGKAIQPILTLITNWLTATIHFWEGVYNKLLKPQIEFFENLFNKIGGLFGMTEKLNKASETNTKLTGLAKDAYEGLNSTLDDTVAKTEKVKTNWDAFTESLKKSNKVMEDIRNAQNVIKILEQSPDKAAAAKQIKVFEDYIKFLMQSLPKTEARHKIIDEMMAIPTAAEREARFAIFRREVGSMIAQMYEIVRREQERQNRPKPNQLPVGADIKPLDVALIPDPGIIQRIQAIAETYANTYAEVVDIVTNSMQEILNAEQQTNEAQIKIQQTRVAQALKIAERGNAEYLEKEQDRLDQLQRKQEAFARQQMAINLIQSVSATVLAIAKAASQSGVAAPIAIIEVIAALAAGIASGVALVKGIQQGFAEGGYTGAGRKREPRGIVHANEYVMDEQDTAQNREAFEEVHSRKLNLRKLMDKARSYDALQARINTEKMSDMVIVHNTSKVELAEVRDKLEEVVQAIKNKKETSVTITREGIGIIATEYQTDVKKLSKLAS